MVEWKIWKNLITKQAAQTWRPAVEESDLALIFPTFPDSKKPSLSRLGLGSPIFQSVSSWEFGKCCTVLRLSRYKTQCGEGKDVIALWSDVIPSPIFQYLLMPKR